MARSRMNADSKFSLGLEPPVTQSVGDNKKELKQEIADIRGFTLIFENEGMEMKWNLMHLERHIGITTRYLFAASVFQGLFYWSDCLESHGDNTYLFQLGCLRLLLGGLTLLGCFLVSTGLVVPTQMTVFWINMCYGFPSLAIFYLARPTASVFDSLFLVYGLCFFTLPKISPLNFIYGFSGALLYTFLFIYISAFRLSLQQWLLSNTFLMIIVSLFCYISYSAERVSRERWLLRERLKRERINLRIVASSIQEDFTRAANDERNYPMNQHNFRYDHTGKAIRLLATLGGGGTAAPGDSDCSEEKNAYPTIERNGGLSTDSPGLKKQKRMSLFFRSLGGWALCYCMGYAFDFVSQPASSFPREINSSPAFALLMHSMGFSVFLMSFTGQIRWLALNGTVGLALMWVFNRSGMDSRWVVFSTHSVGYVLLAVVIVIMILVFGGVVLVWTHLIDFLKEILVRYPEVKNEISENKVLEQVLIRYISDMPKTKFLSRSDKEPSSSCDGNSEESSPHVLQVYKDCDSDEEGACRFRQNAHLTNSKSNTNMNMNMNMNMNRFDSQYDQWDREGPTKSVTQSRLHSDTHSACPSTGAEAGNASVQRKQALPPLQLSVPPSSLPPPSARAVKVLKRKCQAQAHSTVHGNHKGTKKGVSNCSENERDNKLGDLRIIEAKRTDSCFFCLKCKPLLLIPACIGWLPHSGVIDPATGVPGEDAAMGIRMCTPYTEMIQSRDNAIAAADLAMKNMTEAKTQWDSADAEKNNANAAMIKMQKKMSEMEGAMMQLMKLCDAQVTAEKKQRDADVQSIIAQHNNQLSELKRLHKAVAAKQMVSSAAAAAVSTNTESTDTSTPARAPVNVSTPPQPIPSTPAPPPKTTPPVSHTTQSIRHSDASSKTLHAQNVPAQQAVTDQRRATHSHTHTHSPMISLRSSLPPNQDGCRKDDFSTKSPHVDQEQPQETKSRPGQSYSQEKASNISLCRASNRISVSMPAAPCSLPSTVSHSADAHDADYQQYTNTGDQSFYYRISPVISPDGGAEDDRDYQLSHIHMNSIDRSSSSSSSSGISSSSSSRYNKYNQSDMLHSEVSQPYTDAPWRDLYSTYQDESGSVYHRSGRGQSVPFPSHSISETASQVSPRPDGLMYSDGYRATGEDVQSCSNNQQKQQQQYQQQQQQQQQQYHQSEELDINDAESRFWLPSLDFDEIQSMLYQELLYPPNPP